MNNNDKNVKTHNSASKKIPQLRFPEFTGEWLEKKLGEIAEGKLTNGVFNDPQKVGSGYFLINVKDMYSNLIINKDKLTRINIDIKTFENNKVKYGDIFFTRSSLVKEGIAHSAIILSKDNDITFDGHLIKLSPNFTKVDPIFLVFLLKTMNVRKQLIARGKTGTMTTIGQNDIASVKIYIPALPEQEKIADFLTAVDKRIELLQKKKEKLEAYKKGIMQKIFPVETDNCPSPSLRFKDNNGNNFPDWEEKKLGEVGETVGGGTPDTSIEEYWQGNIPWISSSDISDNSIHQIEKKRFITEKAIKESATKLIPKGSILMVSRVGIGKFAIADEDLCTSQDFTNLISNENEYFLGYYFKAKANRFVSLSQGTSIKGFTTKDIKSAKFYFPSLPEQEKIADFLSSIDKLIETVEKQIEQSQQWKKGLLQKMFV